MGVCKTDCEVLPPVCSACGRCKAFNFSILSQLGGNRLAGDKMNAMLRPFRTRSTAPSVAGERRQMFRRALQSVLGEIGQ